MNEVVQKVFEDLIKKYSSAFMKSYTNANEHPILNYLLNKKNLIFRTSSSFKT